MQHFLRWVDRKKIFSVGNTGYYLPVPLLANPQKAHRLKPCSGVHIRNVASFTKVGEPNSPKNSCQAKKQKNPTL